VYYSINAVIPSLLLISPLPKGKGGEKREYPLA